MQFYRLIRIERTSLLSYWLCETPLKKKNTLVPLVKKLRELKSKIKIKILLILKWRESISSNIKNSGLYTFNGWINYVFRFLINFWHLFYYVCEVVFVGERVHDVFCSRWFNLFIVYVRLFVTVNRGAIFHSFF